MASRSRSDRTRAAVLLSDGERSFRALADSIPQLAWMADATGWIFWYNERWYEYTGTTLEEMEGWGWQKVHHPQHVDRVVDRIRHAFETGEPWEDTFPLRSKTGEYRWFLSRALPIKDADGHVIRWFGTNTDVTEQLDAAAEREHLLERERQARERATTILESITDAFFALDHDWRFTYVNREAERLLEKSRDELLGRSIWEEFREAVGTRFFREYQRAMTERVTVEFEEFYRPLNNWFEVHAYPSPEGLSVYFHEVTERRRAADALRESEERYRLLADMIPQHIWTTEADGYHTYFSRRWYDYTGATPDETRGDGWLELLHPEDRDRTLSRWQHSLRTGEPYTIEYRFRSADGTYSWFLGQAMPLRNESGDIVRWFGTLTDISQRKRLEEERERLLARAQDARAAAERQRDELERMTESRARLIRGFSHDVKNPLGAAEGYLQLMTMDRLSEKQRERIEKVQRSVRAAVNLIEDLLELSRAEAGEIAIERAPTDLRDVARDAAEEYRAQAEAKGLSLMVDWPDRLPVVASDASRIRQVVGNLLANAVKYTDRGGITVSVKPSSDPKAPRPGRWIAIGISDTGPGIPAEQQPLIFQEFGRLETAGEKKGVGIGLAISCRIAHALGGDITIDSELKKGSTFTLWLPSGREGQDAVTHTAGK